MFILKEKWKAIQVQVQINLRKYMDKEEEEAENAWFHYTFHEWGLK